MARLQHGSPPDLLDPKWYFKRKEFFEQMRIEVQQTFSTSLLAGILQRADLAFISVHVHIFENMWFCNHNDVTKLYNLNKLYSEIRREIKNRIARLEPLEQQITEQILYLNKAGTYYDLNAYLETTKQESPEMYPHALLIRATLPFKISIPNSEPALAIAA